MDHEAIMEMLREYGVNSKADLAKAMKHLKPINIGLFVTPIPECKIIMNEPKSNDILIKKEEQNEREPECACV